MSEEIKTAAIIGGGLIGAGWAARLVLNGIDVSVYDPSEEAEQNLAEVLSNAKHAYSKLTMAPLLNPGKMHFVNTIEDAVKGMMFIQESVPENPDLKGIVLEEIDKFAPGNALICSSTSGIKPSQLQVRMKSPQRFMVGHPFNPVYLLPLVEICGGEQTSTESKDRAAQFYHEIGMKPLILRKEIDAFIADRLLEAAWREGLWLIRDDVATTEELDDAIRFGFGLRWAQMGLFETYRIAGGKAGMRHFISQFGPTLSWPWTRLMDVPDLNQDLIDKIVEQSDKQSSNHSIRDLERIRDENLVAIMQSLKLNNWGAGSVLKDYEELLYKKAHSGVLKSEPDFSIPLRLYESVVPPDWLDYNGHMNESRYLQVFSDASDAMLHLIGMDEEYRSQDFSFYTVETHIRHLNEVGASEPIFVETQLLGFDEKRIRINHILIHTPSGNTLATGEHMLLHVNTEKGHAVQMGKAIYEILEKIWEGHQNLAVPEYAGKGIMQLKNL